MSKAILTATREITQDDINRDGQAAQDKAVAERAEYERQCRHAGISPQNKAAGESGRLCSGGGWDRVKTQWIRVQRAESSARQAADSAKHRKARKATVNIAVVDSYDIKDALKSRGYRFNRDGYWVDFLGMHTKAAWVREVAPVSAEAEIAALRDLGATVEADSAINQMLKPEAL
jgi:hypothetical protein